ncbi:hypothetical protein FM130_08385 [Enterococcus faecium]|uniref:hypothetical protein n=1 Tax=Enterococcus faecium TaxID=1352 RepID=UPI000989A5B7|nr:hypothetical protein [Enterococcus faecium]SJX70721.1 hypothetical protein FM130_08385 [Enterococcus faecium]
MGQQRSFQNYVSKHHYNDLHDAVASFVANNLDDLSLQSHHIDVDRLDEDNVYFEDLKVKYVFVNGDTTANDIEFDVILFGEVYLVLLQSFK